MARDHAEAVQVGRPQSSRFLLSVEKQKIKASEIVNDVFRILEIWLQSFQIQHQLSGSIL